ncbi:hypothetical protein K457DRAFT_24272, partial [Linnemannia elongata AG-77]
MSSSSPQCRSSSPLPAPPSASRRHPEITADGQRVLSQLENTTTMECVSLKGDTPTIVQGLANIELGPANLLSPLSHRTTRDVAVDVDHGPGVTSGPKSASSGRSSKIGYRKRFSRHFKVKEPVLASAASSAPITLVETGEPVQSAAPDRKA